MSAAIAALVSYGGSDSEPDSEPEAEGGSQSAAVVATRDAVLHLRAPAAAPAALAVDAAPEVAVKVGVPPPPGRPGPRVPARRCGHCVGFFRWGQTALGQPRPRERGGPGAGALSPPGLALTHGVRPELGVEGVCRRARPVDPTVAVKLIKAYYVCLKSVPCLALFRYSCLQFPWIQDVLLCGLPQCWGETDT